MSVLSLFARRLSASVSVPVMVLLAACEAPKPRPTGLRGEGTSYSPGISGVDMGRKHYDNDSFFIGDKVSGPPSIKIVLSEQKAYLYKGGKLAGMSRISTGSEGHATTTGSFHITQKEEDHKSSQYGNFKDANDKIIQADVDTERDKCPPGAHYEGANMPYFMRFNGGTGMHEGFMPGYPDSHGCIRMPGWIAKEFYDTVEVGTPVTVVN